MPKLEDGFLIKHWLHWMVWKADRLMCCFKASNVDGIFSVVLTPSANWILLATLTLHVLIRGGVEDTRLEAKDQGYKCNCFPKEKGLANFFLVNLQKNGLEEHFSADLQNFNHSKNSAVLEPRTGQFLRTWGFEAKANAKDLKMCPRGRPQGLHLWCW